MTEEVRPPQAKRTFLYATVRYGRMAHVGRFKTDREGLGPYHRCIVRSDRGREMGTVLTPFEPLPENVPAEGFLDVLRKATPEDLRAAERIDRETRVKEMGFVKEEVRKLNLPMKVVEVDHLFGGERVVVYFVSETRVDFRELVRRLAHEFRTRIELKQVGARDEARLVGDCGHCGMALCCRGHLRELGGIMMDMAKLQKHTADPAKITGRCGKLLCCLRYEYGGYCEARETAPPKGVRVETRRGSGVVVEQNFLLRQVTIVPEGRDERVVVGFEEVVSVPKPPPAAPPQSREAARPEPAAPVAVQTEPAEDTKAQWATIVEEPPAEFVPVARLEEVPAGRGKQVEAGGRAIALFRIGDAIYATEAACPHQAGPLAEGKLEGQVVTCPSHGWQFNVVSGEGPGPSKLFTYETKVENGQVFVKI